MQTLEVIPKIEEEIGAIDILVNNAGVQRRAPLDQIEETAWPVKLLCYKME